MNDDWAALLEQCPWLAGPATNAQLGKTSGWTRAVPRWAPGLAALLTRARVTPVAFDGRNYELLAWEGRGGPHGWLCPAPPDSAPTGLYPAHRELLATFGGIVDRFGGASTTWLDNTNDSLTVELATGERTLAPVVEAHDWRWTDEGLGVPDVDGYYGISEEANGNLTACHRDTGAVLLFAGDHDLDHVTPLAGCPEYSLYVLHGAPNLRAWVARVADQWLDDTG